MHFEISGLLTSATFSWSKQRMANIKCLQSILLRISKYWLTVNQMCNINIYISIWIFFRYRIFPQHLFNRTEMIGLAIKHAVALKFCFIVLSAFWNDNFVHTSFPLNLFGLKKMFGVMFRNLYVNKPELLIYLQKCLSN